MGVHAGSILHLDPTRAERAAAERFGEAGEKGCCQTCGSRRPDDHPDIMETTEAGTNSVPCPDAFHSQPGDATCGADGCYRRVRFVLGCYLHPDADPICDI